MNPIDDGILIKCGADPLASGFNDVRLNDVFYELTADAEQERLILESASFEEINMEYNPGDEVESWILEAIRVIMKKAQTRRKAVWTCMPKSTAHRTIAAMPETAIQKDRRMLNHSVWTETGPGRNDCTTMSFRCWGSRTRSP